MRGTIALVFLGGALLSAVALSSATKTTAPPYSRVIKARASDRIVLGAYGDTRTGPYNLGDNKGQQIHGSVVESLLTKKDYDAVIFTGDAVMTNFPLWAGQYWTSYLKKQT
jgi:hypothetical protein